MDIKLEKQKLAQGFSLVIGCDEAGRGPLAGPVVAAAVSITTEIENIRKKFLLWDLVMDSKKLSASKRILVADEIKQHLNWSIKEISVAEIEKINILQAALLAMRLAAEELAIKGNAYIMVDGNKLLPNDTLPQEAVIGGDNKVFSIAAASILAKVYRDEIMDKLDKLYPEYGLAKHKGYGTLAHRQAIIKHGLSPIHRPSFCKNILK